LESLEAVKLRDREGGLVCAGAGAGSLLLGAAVVGALAVSSTTGVVAVVGDRTSGIAGVSGIAGADAEGVVVDAALIDVVGVTAEAAVSVCGSAAFADVWAFGTNGMATLLGALVGALFGELFGRLSGECDVSGRGERSGLE
jgi:hypothetical protein